MKKKILFVQGGGVGAYKEDKALADYLRSSLSPKYDILYPQFSGLEDIDYKAWRTQIASEFSALGDEKTIIAHSLGAASLPKYLAEEKDAPQIDGLFLIATPYKCTDGEWGTDEFAIDIDFASSLPAIRKIVMYHSLDDEWVPFAHLSRWSEKLPQAITHELDERGHLFSEMDFVELVDEFDNHSKSA